MCAMSLRFGICTQTPPGEKLYNIETDLLMVCDKMYLTTQPIGILRKEVEYARKIGLEVVDLAKEYRTV